MYLGYLAALWAGYPSVMRPGAVRPPVSGKVLARVGPNALRADSKCNPRAGPEEDGETCLWTYGEQPMVRCVP